MKKVSYHMKNREKIKIIENIVQPFFTFEMDDFIRDRGGLLYPEIEELTILFFKKNGNDDKKLFLTKKEQQILLDKIQFLHIGYAEIIKNPYFGTYIIITLD